MPSRRAKENETTGRYCCLFPCANPNSNKGRGTTARDSQRLLEEDADRDFASNNRESCSCWIPNAEEYRFLVVTSLVGADFIAFSWFMYSKPVESAGELPDVIDISGTEFYAPLFIFGAGFDAL